MKFLGRKTKTIRTKLDSQPADVVGPLRARTDAAGRQPDLRPRMDRAPLKSPELEIPGSIWRSISQHYDPNQRKVRLDGAALSIDERAQLIQIVAALNRTPKAKLDSKSDCFLAGTAMEAFRRFGVRHGQLSVSLDLTALPTTEHLDAAPVVVEETESRLKRELHERSSRAYLRNSSDKKE